MVIMTTFHHPESPILFQEQNVKAVLDSKDLGTGTLYISERTLCWNETGGTGFCIEYPNISMHAIATDRNVYSSDCIFIMTDGHIVISEQEEPAVEDNDDDSTSEVDFSELLLVPSDVTSIRTIFNSLNECQLLNPDPNDEIDEEEVEFEDAEEYVEENNGRVVDLGAAGDSEMNQLSSDFHNYSLNSNIEYRNGNGDQHLDDEQFEDAD